MVAMSANIMAITTKLGSEQQQTTAPVNLGFANAPTPAPQASASSQSSHDEQIPPRNDTGTTRWRGEELEIFDSAVDDVYTFINRMHQVAGLRGYLLVQLNVSLQLKGLTKERHEVELGPRDKTVLSKVRSIQSWLNPLI